MVSSWRMAALADFFSILLDLHPLNLFIRRDQFVPDLHHQLERHVRLLQRDHRAVKVLRFARHEGVHRSARFQLRLVDLSDR
jgi:hypothetical protein